MGRVEKDDILVSMNSESFEDDIKKLKPGGLLLYHDSINPKRLKETLTLMHYLLTIWSNLAVIHPI